jgi:hypothetical protein
MSTAGRAPLRAFAHRRAPRCSLTVPVRITVMRAGAAHSVAGRSLDLGEGGIAVSLSSEMRISDSVAVEFLLPDLGLGLQIRAIVRYRTPSHWGLEFRGLTRHQQAVIREWTRQQQLGPAHSANVPPVEKTGKSLAHFSFHLPKAQMQRVILIVLAAIALAALILLWRWERAWKELEDQIPQTSSQQMPGYYGLCTADPQVIAQLILMRAGRGEMRAE